MKNLRTFGYTFLFAGSIATTAFSHSEKACQVNGMDVLTDRDGTRVILTCVGQSAAFHLSREFQSPQLMDSCVKYAALAYSDPSKYRLLLTEADAKNNNSISMCHLAVGKTPLVRD